MKSKTSFFNCGLFFSNMKRYSWVSLVWAALIFLTIPMRMLTMEINNYMQYWGEIRNINIFMQNFGGALANFMLCGFPVLIGVLMFRYLHSPKSATVMHGLPFSRPRLFANGVISGLVLILFPLLLNTLIIVLVKAAMPIGNYIEYASVFTWLLNSVCIAFAVFALTVFAGMFTGNIMAHFVFTYIIHFLPIGLWLLVNTLFSVLVYGYSFEAPPDWLINFPMIKFAVDTMAYNAWYAAAGAVLLVMAMFAYRVRPLENASDIVVFRFIRPVFKYGVTFCMAIAGYIYFCVMTSSEQSIIVALIFALIGYAVAQMLLQKTWRIWNAYKGLIVSIAVIFVFWGAVEFDITGYERRVPDVSGVESVTITSLPGIPANMIELKSEADIAPVLQFHKKLTDKRGSKNQNKYGGEGFTVKYEMKNGGVMERSYSYEAEEYKQELITIYNLAAVREQGFPILKNTADDIDAVSVQFFSARNDGKRDYRITDKKQINDLLNVFKVDINNMPGSDILDNVYDGNGADIILQFEMRPKKDYLAAEGSGSSYESRRVGTIYTYNLYDRYESTTMWIERNMVEQQ